MRLQSSYRIFPPRRDENPKLKANKAAGTIEIDATTTLHGIPAAAWSTKLAYGRSSATL